jgi:hypothetical protein
MGKSIFFFGQSVFGQLISLFDRFEVKKAIERTNSDRYCKGFYTWDHLVSMLFCTLGGCNSLREVAAGCLGLKGKTEHLGLKRLPKRSTLSDANKNRTPKVFELIYYTLLERYRPIISDSRFKEMFGREVKIFDSTTITLFKSILKAAGRKPKSGKEKGGIKVHTLINADENVPELVWFSSSATSDQVFWKKITFKKDTVYVFDKGYIDHTQYEKMAMAGSFFVTRLQNNATYEHLLELDIPDDVDPGVLKDEEIAIAIRKNGKVLRTITFRKVAYWDEENARLFEFITNLKDIGADKIASLYKQRWQIETLFKQFKQNFTLKYFLGDNENAIIIQIWCSLIANLLITIIRKQLTRRWSFSNIVSFTRLHLFNYIHLLRFLEDPEKDWEKDLFNLQPTLFSG